MLGKDQAIIGSCPPSPLSLTVRPDEIVRHWSALPQSMTWRTLSNVMPDIELTKAHDALTLSELLESGHGLALRCCHCGSLNILDVAYLIANHGGQTRLGYIRHHAQCETCREPKDL